MVAQWQCPRWISPGALSLHGRASPQQPLKLWMRTRKMVTALTMVGAAENKRAGEKEIGGQREKAGEEEKAVEREKAVAVAREKAVERRKAMEKAGKRGPMLKTVRPRKRGRKKTQRQPSPKGKAERSQVLRLQKPHPHHPIARGHAERPRLPALMMSPQVHLPPSPNGYAMKGMTRVLPADLAPHVRAHRSGGGLL